MLMGYRRSLKSILIYWKRANINLMHANATGIKLLNPGGEWNSNISFFLIWFCLATCTYNLKSGSLISLKRSLPFYPSFFILIWRSFRKNAIVLASKIYFELYPNVLGLTEYWSVQRIPVFNHFFVKTVVTIHELAVNESFSGFSF